MQGKGQNEAPFLAPEAGELIAPPTPTPARCYSGYHFVSMSEARDGGDQHIDGGFFLVGVREQGQAGDLGLSLQGPWARVPAVPETDTAPAPPFPAAS